MRHRRWVCVAIATASVLASFGVANLPASAASGVFTQPAPVTVEHGDPEPVGAETTSPFEIPDTGEASSQLILTAPANATTTRVLVSVQIDHDSIDDVDLVLVAPNGRAATLISDAGGSTSVEGWLRFFADYDLPYGDDSMGSQGGYSAPVDYDTTVGDIDAFPGAAPASLAQLGGTQVAGTWTLHAYDDTAGTTGAVNGWALTVDYGLPASPSPSELVVRGLPRGITDVNLALDDLTGHAGQSEFLLESPDGRFAHVLSDFSEYDDPSNVDLTLDDEATLPISPYYVQASGTFRPVNYPDQSDLSEPVAGIETKNMSGALSVFDGGTANGTWKLWVFQTCCGPMSVSGWSLQITTAEPPAAPVVSSPTSGAYVVADTVTLSGTAAAGAEVRATGSGTSGTTLASGNAWSITIPDLPDGNHTFAVTQTDAFGNVSAPAEVTVRVDTVRPRLVRSTPTKGDGAVTRSVSPTLRFTEELKPTSLTAQNIRLTTAAGKKVKVTLAWSAARKQLVVNPTHRLAAHTRYRLAVKTGVRDLAGNRLQTTKRVTFTTAGPRP